MPRLPTWRVPGIGRLCTPFGRRTTVGNPGFGFQPYHSPPSLVHPPCCGVDDSGRLLGGSGGARARVRARGPCSPLPGFRPGSAVPVPFLVGLGLVGLSLVGLGLVGLGLIPVLGLGLRPRPRLCLWSRPWPRPRPRPSSLPASGARVAGWFSAGGCRARGWRAPPSSPTLRCRLFPSAPLAVTFSALVPLRRPS